MDLWYRMDRAMASLEELYAGRPSPIRFVKLVRGWFTLRRMIWDGASDGGGRYLLSANKHLADRLAGLQERGLSVIVKPWGAYATF